VKKIRDLEQKNAELERLLKDLRGKSENQKASLAELTALAEETERFVQEREKRIAELQGVLNNGSTGESERVKELTEALEAAKAVLQEQVETAIEFSKAQMELDKLRAENEDLRRKLTNKE
jgi:hypothetical protein